MRVSAGGAREADHRSAPDASR